MIEGVLAVIGLVVAWVNRPNRIFGQIFPGLIETTVTGGHQTDLAPGGRLAVSFGPFMNNMTNTQDATKTCPPVKTKTGPDMMLEDLAAGDNRLRITVVV